MSKVKKGVAVQLENKESVNINIAPAQIEQIEKAKKHFSRKSGERVTRSSLLRRAWGEFWERNKREVESEE